MIGTLNECVPRLAAAVIIELALYRELFTADRYPSGFIPWNGRSSSQVAGMRPPAQNKTPLVDEQVLQPMLAATLYLTTTIGPHAVDLLQQVCHRRHRHAALPATAINFDDLAQVLAHHTHTGRALEAAREVDVRTRLTQGWDPADPLLQVSTGALAREAGRSWLRRDLLNTARPMIEQALHAVGVEKPWAQQAASVPRADGGPATTWTLPLDDRQVRDLVCYLNTGCLLVTATVTGMRKSEPRAAAREVHKRVCQDIGGITQSKLRLVSAFDGWGRGTRCSLGVSRCRCAVQLKRTGQSAHPQSHWDHLRDHDDVHESGNLFVLFKLLRHTYPLVNCPWGHLPKHRALMELRAAWVLAYSFTLCRYRHKLHLLRDLDGAAEVYPTEEWPDQIATALRRLIHQANSAREQGQSAIDATTKAELTEVFHDRVLVGLSDTTSHGDRPGERKARLLLEVLHDRQGDVLRFADNLAVPPTSNQAERDLRPSKIQQNISGRLTSQQRTKDRYKILGYVSTAGKTVSDGQSGRHMTGNFGTTFRKRCIDITEGAANFGATVPGYAQ